MLGSTGEYHSLTENGRHDLIDFIFKKVAGRCKIMIGVSAVSVETTCAAIEQAMVFNPHAIMLGAPYYVLPSQQGLYDYF